MAGKLPVFFSCGHGIIQAKEERGMNIFKRLFFKLWDPDFAKLTAEERASLEAAEAGEWIPEEEFWRIVSDD